MYITKNVYRKENNQYYSWFKKYMELQNVYAVRDRATGYFLNGKRIAVDGNPKLYVNPGPAKGLVTRLRKDSYYNSGAAGYFPKDLEVVAVKLVPILN